MFSGFRVYIYLFCDTPDSRNTIGSIHFIIIRLLLVFVVMVLLVFVAEIILNLLIINKLSVSLFRQQVADEL